MGDHHTSTLIFPVEPGQEELLYAAWDAYLLAESLTQPGDS